MDAFTPHLDWIESQLPSMIALLEKWVNINSWSNNLAGLQHLQDAITEAFTPLKASSKVFKLPDRTSINSNGEEISEPSPSALHFGKRPKAPIKVLLGGHMDTVFPPSHPFQKAIFLDKQTLQGPGAADMKGGLVVMLKALEALERSPFAKAIGWEVLINPDEEIGSVSSESVWVEAAKRNSIGLLFEPAFSDGAIVTARKGSANFTLVARGRSAHAGRDFFHGKNAISALARFIVHAEKLIDEERGVTFNVGKIEGGEASNIVPDLAIAHLNIRVNEAKDFDHIRKSLHAIIASENNQEGILLTLFEQCSRVPKPFNKPHQALLKSLQGCAKDLHLALPERTSGGVCDGNILAAAGLPTLDSLGVVGGNLHTSQEYMLINSLVERAQLVAYFLMKMAQGSA